MDCYCRIRLKESIVAVLQVKGKSSDLQLEAKPAVLLIVGVNGGGKTTTIGKLAHKLGHEGAKASLPHSCHAICAPATVAQAFPLGSIGGELSCSSSNNCTSRARTPCYVCRHWRTNWRLTSLHSCYMLRRHRIRHEWPSTL